MSRYRTPLKNVRGLGAAKTGTEHFVVQRLTATALVPLSIWFLILVLSLIGADHTAASAAVAKPWNAILLVGFLIASFWHAQSACRWCWRITCTTRCSPLRRRPSCALSPFSVPSSACLPWRVSR